MPANDFPTADFPTLRAALAEARRLTALTKATHVVCLTMYEGALSFFVILEATFAFLRERQMTQYAAPVALVVWMPPTDIHADPADGHVEASLYDAIRQ